jgi:hypothetical protein
VSEIKSSETRYVFLKQNRDVSEQKVMQSFFLWKDKYPGFGCVQSDLGVLLDTRQVKEISEDMYYSLIFGGVIAIRDETVNTNLR